MGLEWGSRRDLRVLDAIDNTGGGEVEDTCSALYGGEEGGRVEEVDMEEAETKANVIEGLQLLSYLSRREKKVVGL